MITRDCRSESEFRRDFRQWLTDHAPSRRYPTEPGHPSLDIARDWTRILHKSDYSSVSWPVQFGGRGLPQSFDAIILDELAIAGAPEPIGDLHPGVVAPSLLRFGSTEQKQQHLNAIASGRQQWCQAFSEEGSSSDRAGVRLRATAVADSGWVLNGQKMWSSYAQNAHYCLVLAHTEPEISGPKGQSLLIVDLASEGIEVCPIINMAGYPEFNEIVFRDVKVSASALLGGRGQGWQIIRESANDVRGLRAVLEASRLISLLSELMRLMENISDSEQPSAIRARWDEEFFACWGEAQGIRVLAHRVLTAQTNGAENPGLAVVRLLSAPLSQRITQLAIEVQGAAGLLTESGRPGVCQWSYEFLRARAKSIEGGTIEMTRSIIAQAVLGLPSERSRATRA